MYITIAQVRAQDASGAGYASWSDAEITAVITKWQSVIERELKLWFESRSLQVKMLGSDSKFLHFDIPIVSVESVYVNEDSAPADPSYYRVYNSVSLPDDRDNPKIELIPINDDDIFSDSLEIFRADRQQVVNGHFGYVESGGVTPEPVKLALLMVVVDHMGSKYINDPVMKRLAMAGSVSQESLDKYSYKLAEASTSGMVGRLTALLGNREAALLLSVYRRPISVGVTV